MEIDAQAASPFPKGTIILAQSPVRHGAATFRFPMAAIARTSIEASAPDPWKAIARAVHDWSATQRIELRDAIVLVPFVQLLAPARRAFALAGGWMPRVETTRTLADSLGPPPARGSGELGWGIAHDTLLAMQTLSRQSWVGDWARRVS
ncbi:MAG: hypothetical protein ACXWJ7_17515 [Caldimonas sp.]